MKPVALRMKSAWVVLAAAILAAGPVMAEKPSWAGSGKGGKDQRDEQKGERHDKAGSAERRSHFEERHRSVAHEYYAEQFRSGRCPPGLAKKNNGCLPPGQAKKWQVGRPLPSSVVYYEVPQALVVQIGPPPRGHRYVRVASDILLIAIGTGLVVDAVQDLGR